MLYEKSVFARFRVATKTAADAVNATFARVCVAYTVIASLTMALKAGTVEESACVRHV